MTKGDIDNALKYSEDALIITRKIGQKIDEAAILDNFGLIYKTKGDIKQALNYHNQALEIFKQIGAKREIEQIENNIRALKGK